MSKERKKILVIDDDLGIIKLLDKRLQSQGFNVVGATKGKDGVEQIKTELPDVIILDLMIPDMDGRDVTRAIKADPTTKDIPIIFISVTLTHENPKELKEIRIDDEVYPIFPKPFFTPKLLSVIRKKLKNTE